MTQGSGMKPGRVVTKMVGNILTEVAHGHPDLFKWTISGLYLVLVFS